MFLLFVTTLHYRAWEPKAPSCPNMWVCIAESEQVPPAAGKDRTKAQAVLLVAFQTAVHCHDISNFPYRNKVYATTAARSPHNEIQNMSASIKELCPYRGRLKQL